MGCFSYICPKCGKGINSSSLHGENVKISLLIKGRVVEEMQGPYDSYGRVFDYEWESKPWGELVDLHFGKDPSSGFAVVHVACDDGTVPTTRSDDDPDQGWNLIKKKHKGECEIYHKTNL